MICAYLAVRKKVRALIGKIGVTTSSLTPGGRIEIDGENYFAESADGSVDEGRGVRVIGSRGGTVVVKLV